MKMAKQGTKSEKPKATQPEVEEPEPQESETETPADAPDEVARAVDFRSIPQEIIKYQRKVIQQRNVLLLQHLGVTRKALAEYLEIAQPTLTSRMNGKLPWTAEELFRLCRLGGVSADYIIGLDEALIPHLKCGISIEDD